MSKWEKVKLRDVCEINIGKTPSRDNVLFWNNGIYKWLSISDVQDKYLIDSKEKISMEAVGKCNMKLIPINTVVMSFKLSVGKVGILSEPMYSNEAIANFPILNCEKLHANFLYYALQSLKFENMDRAAKGLTLNKAKLNQLKIPLPPLKVQQKIAQTLDAAAELLALRKQQLAEMDNLIKAVFYEMFGDPVANEKGWETYNSSIYSEMITVGVVIKPASYYTDKGVPALRSLNIKPNRVELTNLVYFSEEDSNSTLSKSVLRQGDVVVVRTGSTGTAAVIPKELEGANCIDLIIVRPKKEILNPHYLAFLLNSESGKKLTTSKGVGGIQKHFNIGAIKGIAFPIPPISFQNQFAAIVTKIEEQKALVQMAIDESQYLFDSLMNEYFN